MARRTLPMSEETPARPETTLNFPLVPAVLLLLVLCAAGYGFHERNVAKKLAADNGAIAANLSATRDQLNTLSAKVNALDAKPSPEPASKPAAAVYRKPLTAAVSRHTIHRSDDPRWKKVQGQLDDQGRQIELTRADLASTRTELQGSIAKTHDELVLLEKKGERNYFEFDLDKASGFEPVVFYPADEKLPVEIVINSVTKNHIHGYVSAPKYRGADLQAMANSGSGDASASGDQASSDAKPSPARQRLPSPVTPGR